MGSITSRKELMGKLYSLKDADIEALLQLAVYLENARRDTERYDPQDDPVAQRLLEMLNNPLKPDP
jgi:hypothetical protein